MDEAVAVRTRLLAQPPPSPSGGAPGFSRAAPLAAGEDGPGTFLPCRGL